MYCIVQKGTYWIVVALDKLVMVSLTTLLGKRWRWRVIWGLNEGIGVKAKCILNAIQVRGSGIDMGVAAGPTNVLLQPDTARCVHIKGVYVGFIQRYALPCSTRCTAPRNIL